MKYHSPLRIVIISLAVLLVFLTVSLLSVYVFNIKSPAELVLDRALERIESEKRLNLSFSSLDKHIRNHLTLRDISLDLDGENVISIDELTISNSFMTLLRSLINGSGVFDLSLREANVKLTREQIDQVIELFNSEGSAECEESDSRDSNYLFRIRFYDLNLDISPIVINNAEVYLALSTRDLLRELDFTLSSFAYSNDILSLDAKGLDARISQNNGLYRIDAGLDSVSGLYDAYSLELESVAANVSLSDFSNLRDSAIRFSFEEARIGQSESFYSRLSPSYIRYDGNSLSADISLIISSYLNYALSLSDLNIIYSLDDNRVSFDSVRTALYDVSTPIATMDNLIIDADLNEKEIKANINDLSSIYISNLTKDLYSVLHLNSTTLNFNYSDDYEIELSSSLSLDSTESLLDNTKAAFDLSLTYSDKIERVNASISNLTLPSLRDPLNAHFELEGRRATLNADYSDSLNLTLDYDDEILISSNLRDFEIYSLLPLISRFAPMLEAYIGDDTRLNGLVYANLELDEDAPLLVRGNAGLALGLSDIHFSNFTFNLATSLNANFGDDIEIALFNITTNLIRLSFTGSLNGDNFLPYGELVVENTSSGNRLVTLDLSLNSLREYAFDLRVPPLETINLEGFFNFEDVRHLYSDASLNISTTSYEFYVDLDFRNQNISITNEMANLNLSYGDLIIASLSFDDFYLPHKEEVESGSVIGGRFDLRFDLSSQAFEIYSTDFNLRNLYAIPGSPDISFAINANNERVELRDFLLESSEFLPLSGDALFNIRELSFALDIESESERISLSIMPYSGFLTGYFSLSSFNAARVGLGENLIDAELIGRGANFDSLSFTGTVDFNSANNSKPLSSSGEIEISSRDIVIRNFVYETPNLNISIDNTMLNSARGTLSLPLDLRYTISKVDRDYPIDLSLSLNLSFGESENLYSLITREIRSGFNGLRGRINLNNLLIDNTLSSSGLSSTFTYQDRRLSFSGNFIDGVYSLDGELDGRINLGEVGRFRARGSIRDSINLNLEIRDFSLYFTNMFIALPVITFSEDSLANGDLTVLGAPRDIHLYGSLWSDMIEMDIFWLTDQKVITHNVNFSVWNGDIESSMTAISVVNSQGERTNAKGLVNFYLTESLGLDHYTVEVFLDEGNEIDFRLPITSMNVDIVGRVSGRFYLYQRGLEWVSMSGEMNIFDTQLSLGMYPLPQWLQTRIRTTYDFDLSLRSGNSFIFPLGSNPIISASAAENQRLRFYTSDSGGYGASGAIELRAGEIYYFQRSFFIREGNINFRDNGTSSLDPVINLRAQLRSFDSDGDPVDIFLVLREADLNNFTPSFESSPAKDLSEIMSILGQAIVGNDSTSSNLGSMVSIFTTSVDVLQRIGVINSSDNTLQMSIRNSLNLDTFSLHTNIISNLVYDAVLSGQNSQNWNVSPIARYLDGTALYIGKYISSELYFEILAHLNAHRRSGSDDYDNVSSFLSSDLSLDIEISLEWENPLCTVTLFTRPPTLTMDDTLRYLGLSFSKRFVF